MAKGKSTSLYINPILKEIAENTFEFERRESVNKVYVLAIEDYVRNSDYIKTQDGKSLWNKYLDTKKRKSS